MTPVSYKKNWKTNFLSGAHMETRVESITVMRVKNPFRV